MFIWAPRISPPTPHPKTNYNLSILPYHLISLGSEVGEALSNADLSHAKTVGLECVLQRLSRVGVLDIGAGHSGVDKGDDAAEGLGGRKGGVVADGGDGLGGGVEVLLGGDEGSGRGDDLGVFAELGDDIVGELKLFRLVSILLEGEVFRRRAYLGASAGTSEENTGGLTGQSAGGTGSTKVGESLDEALDKALLAETGLAHSRESGENECLGLHVERR